MEMHSVSVNTFPKVVLGVTSTNRPGVRSSPNPYLEQQFVDIANRSGLFKEVRLLSELHSQPDLIANIYRDYPQAPQVQQYLIAMITLGIVPTPDTYDDSMSFDLMRPNSTALVHIEFQAITSKIFGWFAWCWNITNNRQLKYDDEGYLNIFRSMVLSKSKEIRDILALKE